MKRTYLLALVVVSSVTARPVSSAAHYGEPVAPLECNTCAAVPVDPLADKGIPLIVT